MGLLILAMRNLSGKQVLRTAIIMLLIPLALDVVYMYTFASSLQPLPKTALKVYPDMSPAEVVAGFQSTNFLTVLKTNFHRSNGQN